MYDLLHTVRVVTQVFFFSIKWIFIIYFAVATLFVLFLLFCFGLFLMGA